MSRELLCGAGAGLAADLSTFPLDTIRAKLQVNRTSRAKWWPTLTSTVRSEGILRLYKGLGVVVALSTPAYTLYFAGYETGKRVLGPILGETNSAMHFCAGLNAELWGAMLWCPMDVVKQRLQVGDTSSKLVYRNSLDAVKRVWASEGPLGFYTGLNAALLTYAPFVGLYFVIVEQGKARGVKRLGVSDESQLGFAFHMVNGAVAGATASMVTNPIDVIKTRIQTQHLVGGTTAQYSGVREAAGRILATEGLSGFYKGCLARVATIAPATCISMATYETLKSFIATTA